MRFFLIFFLNIVLLNSLFSKDIESVLKVNPNKKTENNSKIESILKINPPIKYHLHQKYDKTLQFESNKVEKEDDYNFNLDVDIDRELKTIDKLKIDVGTKFKGIN